MSRSLILSFNSAVAKYSRLTRKVRKSITRGEFFRYTRRKRQHLLSRIEKLRRRLAELRTQIKFAGMGIAAAAILSATSADAQKTTIGPFVENMAKNPLQPPAFFRRSNPEVSFVDYDDDGDLDAIIGSEDKEVTYYTNFGNKNAPRFRQYGTINYPFEFNLPGPTGYFNPARTTFADVDNDGDFDMVATTFATSTDDTPDPILFFRNTGNNKEPYWTDDGTNPFAGFAVQRNGWPTFADVDSDGDQDLVVSGYYDDKGNAAWMQYYRNDQVDKTPGVDPTFKRIVESENPFYLVSNAYEYVSISFGDLDEDGDVDLVYIGDDDVVHYKRNDKGTFVEQEGDWIFNDQDHGSTTGNPLTFVSTFGKYDGYESITLADLDGDGDIDATMAVNSPNTSPQVNSYIFIENTGHGTFTYSGNDGVNLLAGVSIGDNASSFFFDYDGDGDNDIVGTSTTYIGSECSGLNCGVIDYSIAPTVFFNEDGKYVPPAIGLNPFPADLPDYGAAKLSDIDGDGDLDLAIIVRQDPENGRFLHVAYYRNDNGTYVETEGPDNPFNFVATLDTYDVHFDVADLDDDGLPDLVMQETNQDPQAYRNIGTSNKPDYQANAEWSTGFVDSFLFQDATPKLVDIDSDGDYDMLLGKYGGSLYYYENQGDKKNPVYKRYINSSSEGDASQWERNPLQDFQGNHLAVPNLADIDGDGDADMLYVETYEGTFGFYENQNPAPVVTPSGNPNLILVANKGIPLDTEMTIVDPDNDNIVKIVVTIAPYDQGVEKLQVPSESSYPNLNFSWDDAKGILTITGNTTAANFQDVLQDIEYLYTGPDFGGRKAGGKTSNGGRTISKTIVVTTLDSDQTVGPTNTATFNIGHSNIAPVIAPAAFNAAYTNTQVPVFPSIVLSDNDDTTLSSAQVSFDSSYKPAEDRLVMNLTGSIAPSFDATTGVLTLTGTGTIAQYQAVLQAVMYDNLSGAAGTSGIRVLNVKVNDGEADSNVGSTQLSINGAVNNPPTITSGAVSPFYISGDLVINNAINVTDADGVILSATVAIASGFTPTEDILVFTDQNGITGSFSSTTGILTLSGSSTVANYQAALRSVKYRNASSTPATDDRAITFTVTDGGTSASLTGTVITINKPPVIKTPTKKTAATDGNIAFPLTAFTDPDNNLNIASLTVTSEYGKVLPIEDGLITIDYSSNGDKTRTDHVVITICDTGGRCTTQNIDVELGALAVIYNAFSPNGDGINDWFYIENLPNKTHVVIYDRWGDPIFETEDYDMSEPASRFEGKNKNGVDVVAGTYYYKVKFDDDANGTKTGYIILNR